MASRRPLPRAFAATRAALLGLLPLLFLVGFSGAVFFSELSGGPIFFGRDTTTWLLRDPAYLTRLLLRSPRRANLMPALYVDVGKRDHLVDLSRDFHAKLRSLGVPHEYRELSGGHDWPYWQRNVSESLRWLAGHLD